MRIQIWRPGIALTVAAILFSVAAGTAAAKDSVAISVTNASGSPVIVNNGQANGTIQLFYTVNANQFPLGSFATFDLNWLTIAGSGKATNYGSGINFNLLQDQQGGNVAFEPAPDTFLVTGAGQSGASTVTVFITTDKDGNPPSSAEGTDLVGNLKLDAGSALNTVTNVQVHIRLVHLSSQCLNVYTFVTDQDHTLGILSNLGLTVPDHGANKGKVVSTNPGQVSDNVLIANTCAADQSFDLKIGLDSSFTTGGANAVFAYASPGVFDSSDITVLLANPLNGPGGVALCLQNVSVPAGSSFLATVHSRTVDNLPTTSLPNDGTFDFAARLFQNVNAACTGVLLPIASPNPATFTLPFTIN